MTEEKRLGLGLNALLICLGAATIALGFLWPKSKTAPEAAPSAASAAAPSPPRKRWFPTAMTYCPGPNCTVERKARDECEKRDPPGVFDVAPDFICTLADGVHRMVCDDIDDEHQCGMMSHSDLEYARSELDDYLPRLVDVDFRVEKFVCVDSERSVRCTFPSRSTGLPHSESPIVCNWMGCSVGSEHE